MIFKTNEVQLKQKIHGIGVYQKGWSDKVIYKKWARGGGPAVICTFFMINFVQYQTIPTMKEGAGPPTPVILH